MPTNRSLSRTGLVSLNAVAFRRKTPRGVHLLDYLAPDLVVRREPCRPQLTYSTASRVYVIKPDNSPTGRCSLLLRTTFSKFRHNNDARNAGKLRTAVASSVFNLYTTKVPVRNFIHDHVRV